MGRFFYAAGDRAEATPLLSGKGQNQRERTPFPETNARGSEAGPAEVLERQVGDESAALDVWVRAWRYARLRRVYATCPTMARARASECALFGIWFGDSERVSLSFCFASYGFKDFGISTGAVHTAKLLSSRGCTRGEKCVIFVNARLRKRDCGRGLLLRSGGTMGRTPRVR